MDTDDSQSDSSTTELPLDWRMGTRMPITNSREACGNIHNDECGVVSRSFREACANIHNNECAVKSPDSRLGILDNVADDPYYAMGHFGT